MIAVIDTETNWDNALMSVGCVIADEDGFTPAAAQYYVIAPEYTRGGMFSDVLFINESVARVTTRNDAQRAIKKLLRDNGVELIFAYNARFDRALLPLLASFRWFDIMRLAAYRQYNRAIPDNADCCGTGRLRRNYGVEPILRLLTGDPYYCETHNALCDALDELAIMRALGHGVQEYECAAI